MRTKVSILLLATIMITFNASVYAEVVNIGFAAPLSGPQAMYGKDLQNGMTLAVEEFNARKPKIAGKEINIKLLVEDDQADARLGVQIAQKMVDKGVKGVFGHYNSSVAIPASRVYQQAGIPQLSGSTAPDFTRQGHNTAYRITASDSQQGATLARFVVIQKGIKEIVIIDDRTAYGQGIADEFDKAAKAAGAKIVGREFTSNTAHDFKPLLTRIKKNNPQAVFFGGMSAQAAALVKQMRELKMTAILLGGEPIRVGNFRKLAGHAANGTMVVLGGRPLEKMPGGLAFKKRYEMRFSEAADVLSPHSYDGTMAMLEAMKKADSVEPAKYRPFLTKIERNGVTNNRFAYNDYGDLRDGTVTIYKMTGNGWQALDTITPSINMVSIQ